MHILLVDDEALARSRLQTLLADAAAAAGAGTAPGEPALPPLVVQQADCADAAWALLQTQPIALVLLDIHMPGLDGLSLAARMRSLPRPPALVFVTADGLHAVNAFELDALDYLTKPVRLARLQQTLAKVLRLHKPVPADEPPTPAAALLILDRGRTERVLLTEVLYFKAELKYVTVRTAAQSYILDSALNELETQHAAHFLRIHRNALVARRALRALEKYFDPEEGEGWAVRLHGIHEPLAVSRRQLAGVRAALRDSTDP
ncbi:LytTR family DNA-binding domain-containing protein [Acidovorax sp. Be4]|uniref:LytTR family DNA-binding domain-containing protein n=1 Tax=Acidovorax bellezanensis TaxID=2976702 RepID=A0ABT2PI64_9BURK|nr:LytTR family DNA-binding domain-containing protein [Acidovorax sp. Be4]MCT9809464.1 LytTR family DNA-binding domain-containing protein [Acidovorax sp. Be4]